MRAELKKDRTADTAGKVMYTAKRREMGAVERELAPLRRG
jgi:hypothetical protein